MQNNNELFLTNYIQEKLTINSNVFIFLTGKYASGKSTFSKKLKEKYNHIGVYIIELDEVINNHVIDQNDHNDMEANLNAFKVYKDKVSKKERESFIYYTKKYIKNALADNKIIIIEGALSSHDICKEIFEDNKLLICYFQPIDFESHKLRILSRINNDIINNKYSLPGYWDSNGYFNREEVKNDLLNNINIYEKNKIILDKIIKKYMDDAIFRGEQLKLNFIDENWIFYVFYT